jgi:hypothetical protein
MPTHHCFSAAFLALHVPFLAKWTTPFFLHNPKRHSQLISDISGFLSLIQILLCIFQATVFQDHLRELWCELCPRIRIRFALEIHWLGNPWCLESAWGPIIPITFLISLRLLPVGCLGRTHLYWPVFWSILLLAQSLKCSEIHKDV